MNENARDRLVTLDGLRGIAAISVMLYHTGNSYNFGGPFVRAYLFVDFFFLLSGFVLALSAEPRFARGWTTIAFMRARIRRLWPVIAVGALLGVLSLGLRTGWDNIPLYLVLALTVLPLVRPFGTAEVFPLNPPQWSLLFELFGNLLHGLVLRRLSSAALLVVAAFFGALLVGSAYLQGSNTCGPDSVNWFFGLPRVGCAYTIGVWMGRQHIAGRARRIRSGWLTALSLPLFIVFVAGAVQAGIWLGDSLAVVIAFPLALWIAACSAPPPERVARWLAALGMISFPLYAFHLPVITLFAAHDHSAISALAAVAVSFSGAWGLAVLLERRRMSQAVEDVVSCSSQVQTSVA